MPLKRKALAENPTKANSTHRNTKASKTSAKSTAPKSSNTEPPLNVPAKKSKGQRFKYCNANTLTPAPTYQNLQWPNFHLFAKDRNADLPKPGQLVDEFCYRVSDLGIPVSDDAVHKLKCLRREIEKRDQDIQGEILYTDWNGYGVGECVDNLLKDFNRDVFKKTVSPYKKWAYVETFACYVLDGDLCDWLGIDDGDGLREVVNMIGVMVLTSYDILTEHDLFKPDSEIKNLEIISLILIQFLLGPGQDLDCEWGCEVVRLCDEVGIKLEEHVRKQVSISKKNLKVLREGYKVKQESSDFGRKHGRNGYKAAADIKNWKPEDDHRNGERMWLRWDWKLEVSLGVQIAVELWLTDDA